MHKHARRFIFNLAILLALVALAGCGPSEEVPPGASTPGIILSITSDTCPGVEVSANDQVTMKNDDNVNHPIEVSYQDGEKYLGVKDLQPGDTFSMSFPQAGEYLYSCTEGGDPTGVITVNP